MTVSNTPSWLQGRVWLCLLWLCFLCTNAQALTLGDLAVSSSTSPNFNASIPFSDDKPVRLSALQTRIATESEYAKWGLNAAKELKQLRIRVVTASKTVGYIELYSLTPLTQDSFDLLIWASYSGETILTKYKIRLMEMPSLIKGKTLSTSSQSPATAREKSAANTNSKPKSKPKQDTAEEVAPTPSPALSASEPPLSPENAANGNDTARSPEAFTPEVPTTTPLTVPLASSSEVPLAATSDEVKTAISTTTDSPLSMLAWITALSLPLFGIGFLLGRRRHHKSEELTDRGHADKAKPALRGTALEADSFTKDLSEHRSATAATATEQVAAHEESSATDAMSRSVAVTTRTPASALPTHSLLASRGRPIKQHQIKSAGNANIDLAKIYLNMGDPGTAQMVLLQVMEEGNMAEKAAASQLLKEIS